MAKVKPTKVKATKLVDMEVLEIVHDAAAERLKLLNAQERSQTGAAKTTLADVARSALLTWREPPEIPDRTVRVTRDGGKVVTFRFSMPRENYDLIKKAIHRNRTSVAAVVQAHLIAFARTGEH